VNVRIIVLAAAALLAMLGLGCAKQDFSDGNAPAPSGAASNPANPTAAKPSAQMGQLAPAPRISPTP
jgi:hypothetical protein